MEPVLEKLISFSTSLAYENTLGNPRLLMKMSIADFISVGLAGCSEPVSKLTRDFILEETGKPESSIFGSAQKAPARAAAMVNGTISHALDYDDTHFQYLGHPSVVILPAILAVSEKIGSGFSEMVTSALIGVEITCRIGMWLGQSHFNHGFHQTSTCGSIGAAVAVGSLLQLDNEQMANAIGLVSTRSSGLKSQFGTMGKPFHAGMAASNGVEAALLASRGFVSTIDGLSGLNGFASTHNGSFNWGAFDKIGEEFVFEGIQYKYHACCHGIHASLEALINLSDENKFNVDEISDVHIIVNPYYTNLCMIESPTTGLEMKFSLSMVAALLLNGYDTSALESFTSDLCKDPALIRFKRKIRVTTCSNILKTGSEVTITLNHGEFYTKRYDITSIKSLNLKRTKLEKKVFSTLGDQRSKQLWTDLDNEELTFSDWNNVKLGFS